jgi:hypothetical protein
LCPLHGRGASRYFLVFILFCFIETMHGFIFFQKKIHGCAASVSYLLGDDNNVLYQYIVGGAKFFL